MPLLVQEITLALNIEKGLADWQDLYKALETSFGFSNKWSKLTKIAPNPFPVNIINKYNIILKL